MLEQWNDRAKSWLQIKLSAEAMKKTAVLVKAIAALRSNLESAANLTDNLTAEMQRFTACWAVWRKKITGWGYEVSPSEFGEIPSPVGKVIHLCSPKVSKIKTVLVLPGLKRKEQRVLNPVSLVVHSVESPFPKTHPHRTLPPHWRDILGELELLLVHVKIQRMLLCGMESIHKTKLVLVSKYQEAIMKEIQRRRDSLRNSLIKKGSLYQLATNYWRVEECFWSIFHDDGRPFGYSSLDLLRARVEEWHPAIQRESQIAVQNFHVGKDRLSAIQKSVSSMVLRKKKGVAPGTVLWQLRPAMSVKENNVTRTLPGRVVCT